MSLQHSDSNDTKFRIYSDYFTIQYPQLVMDETGRMNPKADTPMLNFDQLKDLLLSKDLSRMAELEWIEKGPVRFLDDSVDMWGNKVGFCSWPRSGNSFLKKFLEQITGLTTGGEMKQDLTLQCVGMMGEGHAANNRVLFTKTHHPIPIKQGSGENIKCAAPTVNR